MDNKQANLNEGIRARQVFLILEDGSKHGVVNTYDARQMAQEKGLDLLQVSHQDVPVCKLIDYGKFMYEKNKKDKHNKSNQTITKEIQLSYTTQDHDVQVKHKKVKEFLSDHMRVNYVMYLEGREKIMTNQAKDKFRELLNDFVEVATWHEPTISGERSKLKIQTTLLPK